MSVQGFPALRFANKQPKSVLAISSGVFQLSIVIEANDLHIGRPLKINGRVRRRESETCSINIEDWNDLTVAIPANIMDMIEKNRNVRSHFALPLLITMTVCALLILFAIAFSLFGSLHDRSFLKKRRLTTIQAIETKRTVKMAERETLIEMSTVQPFPNRFSYRIRELCNRLRKRQIIIDSNNNAT
ncbi:hypothetical protein GJ496_001134 [Pomphorhynchus laevis]|nr:hypothetical protein GJ496_001134 [Pomphorhynchus laevis]